MVLETVKCKLCEFEVTKNGVWQTGNAIEAHVTTEHPKELAKMKEHNGKLRRKILALKEKYKSLWEYVPR